MRPSAPALRGAEADLDAYAAQAAHQLGEAVALLRGYLAMLESHADGDAELAAAVRGIAAGTERTQRFVDDLLDLAVVGRAASAGGEPASLDAALGAARNRLAPQLHESGASVQAAPLPAVLADRGLLERLFVHLFRAALAAGARSIAVEAAADDGMVRVDIRDDGAPAADDPFAAFARGRGRGPLVGAGVSLTLARRVVELYGGAIAVDRDADGASVTRFTLPAGG